MIINNSNTLIGILGLGKSTNAAISYFIENNIDWIAWDDRFEIDNKSDLHFILEDEELSSRIYTPEDDRWLDITMLLVSPGICFDLNPHIILKKTKERNIQIITDIDLFQSLVPNAKYIGITGTNGKSTTTKLIHHIFSHCGKNVEYGGNIGIPVMDMRKDAEFYILELSSFQLALSSNLNINAAVCLNVTPDHLDKHSSIENYAIAKSRIFSGQKVGDLSVISEDYLLIDRLIKPVLTNPVSISNKKILENGISLINNIIYDNTYSYNQYHISVSDSLIGLHNAENIAASFAVARYFEIKHDCILNALKNFEGLPHRLEIVLKTGNVIFVNDSKATNVASTRSALSSFDKIYWIVGGISKDEGIAALSDLFRKVTHAFLIGQSTENFAAVLEKYKIPYFKCATLENAFNEIMTFPELDGVVLLSPACSSLDQWKNFEARGEAFRSLVKNRFS